MRYRKQLSGFTLLEMILVLAIMSTILLMLGSYATQRFDQFRRDKAVLQIQQVLNAGLAYYIATGAWPSSLATLQPTYLPNTFNPPWPGSSYSITVPDPANFLKVSVTVGGARAAADAGIIAGMLPAGVASGTTVSGQVAIPAEFTNSVRSANFANIYHHGGCAPVPNCPTGMTPQIFVAPISASGMNDSASTNVYPLASISAYAIGPGPQNNVAQCSSNTITLGTSCVTTGGVALPAGNYWRVCEQVVTSKGDIASTNASWGQYANILAITRCAPTAEPVGSGMGVYTN